MSVNVKGTNSERDRLTCIAPTDQDRTSRIRSLNDCLRKHGHGGMIVCTQGITALELETSMRVMKAVETFDDFSETNDPHGEHDCALVEVDSIEVIFKIDYFDPTLSYHSEDATNPSVTFRVMTVMLAHEY
jgi:Protein of unknown function (DUF3768)